MYTFPWTQYGFYPGSKPKSLIDIYRIVLHVYAYLGLLPAVLGADWVYCICSTICKPIYARRNLMQVMVFLTLSGPELNMVALACLDVGGYCSSPIARMILSKPYMNLKAFDKSYKNHIGFAIIRASGEEQAPPTSSHVCATVLSSGPVKGLTE